MTSPIRRGALALALGILGFSLGSARAGIAVVDRPDTKASRVTAITPRTGRHSCRAPS